MGEHHEEAVRALIERTEMPLERIHCATAVLEVVDRIRDRDIENARAAGHSWEQIGAAMGMTGQAAGRHARRAGLVDQPPVRESRRVRRRRLAAAHGALMLRTHGGNIERASADFRAFYGRPLPPQAHTADPDSLPPGYARQRWPVTRRPADWPG